MDESLLEFWNCLNKCGVKYIMVGGLATRFHGFNRGTDDLDMWIKDTISNRQNLRKAFKELGYGDYASIETMQFVPGWTSFYAAGIVLDVMTEMKGLEDVSFDECLEKALIADLEGIPVPFLHINHLRKQKNREPPPRPNRCYLPRKNKSTARKTIMRKISGTKSQKTNNNQIQKIKL